jgi:hypothetical protein
MIENGYSKVISVIIFCITFSLARGQNFNENYLIVNSHSISFAQNDSDLLFLDTIAHKNKFFLFGEIHEVKSNKLREFKFFTYLYSHANVRYYLIEFPPSIAYLYNEYLKSGDEKWLLNGIKYSTEELEFWRKMYFFNKQLPSDQRIEVIGFDFDIDYGRHKTYLYALQMLMPLNCEFPDEIKSELEQLYSFNISSNIQEIKKNAEAIKKSLVLNPAAYQNYFAENYSVIQNIYAFGFKRDHASRDKNLYKSFLKIFEYP